MENHDKIKELFSQKLGNLEAPVRSGLWEGIASQLPSAVVGSTVSTGISLVAKSIIGAVAVTVVGATIYFVSKNETVTTNKQTSEISKSESGLKVNGSDSASEENNTTSSQKIDNKEFIKESSSVIIERAVNTEELSSVDRETIQGLPMHSEKEENGSIKELASKQGELKQRKSETSATEVVKETKQTAYKDEPRFNIAEEAQKSGVTTVVREETFRVTSLPNVFTPNGDNVNDIFTIEYLGKILDFNLIILNDQSKVIFQSVDPDFKWNGRMEDGNLAPVGTYYYVITAKDVNGSPINKYNKLMINY